MEENKKEYRVRERVFQGRGILKENEKPDILRESTRARMECHNCEKK